MGKLVVMQMNQYINIILTTLFIASCFILDGDVANQVAQPLVEIPDEAALNYVNGKFKMNLWLKTKIFHNLYIISDEDVENQDMINRAHQESPERINIFGMNKVILCTNYCSL